MLTIDDKRDIKKIVSDEVEQRTDPLRRSLATIEKKLDILSDIWDFIKDHTILLKDHEERISNLENSPKN